MDARGSELERTQMRSRIPSPPDPYNSRVGNAILAANPEWQICTSPFGSSYVAGPLPSPPPTIYRASESAIRNSADLPADSVASASRHIGVGL
jgi:hypothetical protein